MTGKDRILVALDVPSLKEAHSLAVKLRGKVGGFKVGKQLCTAAGVPAVVGVIGRDVFLDLKFHDIPNTVAGAAKAAASLGVKMFNVHCLGGTKMLRAARAALDEFFIENNFRPLIIGVTILTSHDQASLIELGFRQDLSVSDMVGRLATMAYESGLDGVVCSPHEIEVVRRNVSNPNFLVVTPGIRSSADDKADQKRTMTAGEAVALGASHIVVGRPITGAADPAKAAELMALEIDAPGV